MYTLRSVLFSLYFIAYVHVFTWHNEYNTLYSVLYTLYSVLYTLYSEHWTLYSVSGTDYDANTNNSRSVSTKITLLISPLLGYQRTYSCIKRDTKREIERERYTEREDPSGDLRSNATQIAGYGVRRVRRRWRRWNMRWTIENTLQISHIELWNESCHSIISCYCWYIEILMKKLKQLHQYEINSIKTVK